MDVTESCGISRESGGLESLFAPVDQHRLSGHALSPPTRHHPRIAHTPVRRSSNGVLAA